MRTARLVIGAGLSGLISASLVAAPTALATSHTSQPLPYTTSSSSASSGVAVAGGTVTSASGTAMPGVTVDLYAWPSDAVLLALKPGHLVPTTLLATATTSSAGKYMLRVPAAKLKAAAVESGYANIEIFSAVGGFYSIAYTAISYLPREPRQNSADKRIRAS